MSNVTVFEIHHDSSGFYICHAEVGGKHPHIRNFATYGELYGYLIEHGIAFRVPDEKTQQIWKDKGVFYYENAPE